MRLTTMTDILAARKRLAPLLNPTPLVASPTLGQNIFFKMENLNFTHSFKVRGALNAVLALDDDERARGIVACSAGNHSQGVAYAAKLSGAKAQVVMPTHTPKRKVNGARKLGADIILYGDNYDIAEERALDIASQMGMTFISPYNDTQVVAGQGTIALELFDELPNLERVIVPTSGGGMLSGIGLVCKALNPHCEVIGVQSVATPAMYNYMKGTDLPQLETVAEGLAGDIVERAITLELSKTYADDIILVEEDDIKEAIRWMLREHNSIVEGSGAVGIAAYLTEALQADDKTTAIIISGGNLDYEKLRDLLR